MREIPTIFAPISINTEILSSEKLLALYKFSLLFFPNVGLGILNILLDMEKHSENLVAGISPEKRELLFKELEGITVEIRYAIKDRGKEMIAMPFSIAPAQVLKKVSLGKVSGYDEKTQAQIKQVIFSLLKKEIQHRLKAMLEGALKTWLSKPKWPAMLKDLIKQGLVNQNGCLTEGTTIEDLISGKYARLFKKVALADLINEGLIIKETLITSYQGQAEDDPSLWNEALKEKGILELVFGELNRGEGF